ncbi:MAG: glycosyltransferase family 1 protein [Gammaproteobacteria bacterium]|nr:MAG: glycosyltransferase family 1 protein [Gammaproteobacteria bacterium]
MRKKWRLAYLVSHPIQYQAPLLRLISAEPDIDLTVFFCSDLSAREYHDKGFGAPVRWDVPLLDGYRHEFLPAVGGTDQLSFWRPLNYGLALRLVEGRFGALWIHGWAHWSHLQAVASAKKSGIKVLMRGESGLHLKAQGVKQMIRRGMMRYLAANVDGFLTIGTRNREYYRHYGVPPQRLFPVPYAVDDTFFRERAADAGASQGALRTSLGIEPGRPVILYASKMTDRKCPGDLLEAYLRLSPDGQREPHPYLLFIGDGELRPQLEARAAQTGWGSIRFLGFKNQTELPRYYDLCDVFVLPSLQEPWGLVINEVMNAARAVIVSDEVGCWPDLVRPGENGYVFKAGDIDDLRNALAAALENSERTSAMGQRSLEIIGRWGFREDIAGLRQALASVVEAV